MSYKLLITGASGFIGENLLNYYLNDKADVLNLDIKKPNNEFLCQHWKHVDIRKFRELKNALQVFNPDYIIHLAARTDLDGKTLNDYSANTLGTLNIIKACKSLPNLKRVLFTSSMLVCRPGYIPKNENDYSPSTIYGESKVVMEHIIRKANPKFEWAILRPTSIWGPGFREPYKNFFLMITKKRYFHIGNSGCTKTYGYIGNLTHQVALILKAPKEEIQGHVFYLGDYEATNIKIWANEVGNELGIKIRTLPFLLFKKAALVGDVLKIFGLNFPITSFRLKNMSTDNVVDLSNTKKIAQSLPFTRKEGIIITLRWLKHNP